MEVESGVGMLAGLGEQRDCFSLWHTSYPRIRVSSGKREPPCFSICRAEFAALLRLCLAAGLPVPLGGLAKCL